MTAHNIMGYWTNKAAGNEVGMYKENVTANFNFFNSQNSNYDILYPQIFPLNLNFSVWSDIIFDQTLLQNSNHDMEMETRVLLFPETQRLLSLLAVGSTKKCEGSRKESFAWEIWTFCDSVLDNPATTRHVSSIFLDLSEFFLIFYLLFAERAVYIRGWYGCYASITSPWTIQSPQ